MTLPLPSLRGVPARIGDGRAPRRLLPMLGAMLSAEFVGPLAPGANEDVKTYLERSISWNAPPGLPCYLWVNVKPDAVEVSLSAQEFAGTALIGAAHERLRAVHPLFLPSALGHLGRESRLPLAFSPHHAREMALGRWTGEQTLEEMRSEMAREFGVSPASIREEDAWTYAREVHGIFGPQLIRRDLGEFGEGPDCWLSPGQLARLAGRARGDAGKLARRVSELLGALLTLAEGLPANDPGEEAPVTPARFPFWVLALREGDLTQEMAGELDDALHNAYRGNPLAEWGAVAADEAGCHALTAQLGSLAEAFWLLGELVDLLAQQQPRRLIDVLGVEDGRGAARAAA